MEGLSLDNMLSGDEIDTLFTDNIEDSQDTPPEEKETETNNKEQETTEVDPDTLFDEPESVGSEENNEEKEDTSPNKEGTSPNNSYSSIAQAFVDEGIFPDLNSDDISKVSSPEDLRDLVENHIQNQLDERQKRIDEALNVGVEPSKIKIYENTLEYLDSVTDDILNEEGEKGETLRKQLIYQDYINKGFSKERAEKFLNKSLESGSDIEDAKDALVSNKEFYKKEYNNIIAEAKRAEEEEVQSRKEQADKLKKSILDSKEIFGDLEVNKTTRQKIYDNISKPVYKDEDGNWYTAIQKYQKENSTEFLKNIGLIYTLTDGFKNLDGLVKNKVRKEVSKGFKELTHTLNNTARTSSGSINFASGVNDEDTSFRGWKLDV